MADDTTTPFEVFDALCDLAREFNEYVLPERVRSPADAPSDAKGDRPGDHFNRRAAWADVLGPHGWTVDRVSGDVTYWTRPGKDRGCSATTGKCTSDDGGDLLYVFSSNAGPFDPDAAYAKFSAYAVLNHAGRWGEAARAVAAAGYVRSGGHAGGAAYVGPHPEPEVAPDAADGVAGIADLKAAGAEIRWVWPNWIQQGVLTAVAAEGGTGKTRFAAELVRRIRHGLPWPDGAPMTLRPGKTVALWVVADNHHDEMVTLSEAFGIVECVKLNAPTADPYAGVTLDLMEDFAALEARVKATRPVLVVVDTVGNATDRNMSRQEDAKAFYQPLQLIARRQNVAVLPLTHLNAGGKVLGRRALEKVRTCVRISAADPKDYTCPRRVEVIKSNSKTPPALGLVMGDAGGDFTGPAPAGPGDEGGGTPAAAKPSTKVRGCGEWLEPLVRATARRVSDLRKQAEQAGFSTDALYGAFRLLDLEEVTIQSYKWWRVKVDG